MPEVIRTARREEREELMRFLERCFGSGRGAWLRWQPHLFLEEADWGDYHLVLEDDGRIVSHVGGYRLELVMGPARVMSAGVGNVATLPDERAKGHMSRLLGESVRLWRERGWNLSALWGDRQRYGAFGWERCGTTYTAHLSRRSLERSGIGPAEVEEVDPTDAAAVARVGELHGSIPFRVERPRLDLVLRREGLRVFLGPDGYLISHGDYGDLRVSEIASPADRAPELILGAMSWASTGSANVDMGPGDIDRLRRVVDAMSGWGSGSVGMLRIVHWSGLARDLQPLLQERAEGLPSFRKSVGCRWRDDVEWATVDWDGNALTVDESRDAEPVEVELPRLTALVFGGPLAGAEKLGPLARLLPVPMHVHSLDHV